jgi:hypothetical protein
MNIYAIDSRAIVAIACIMHVCPTHAQSINSTYIIITRVFHTFHSSEGSPGTSKACIQVSSIPLTLAVPTSSISNRQEDNNGPAPQAPKRSLPAASTIAVSPRLDLQTDNGQALPPPYPHTGDAASPGTMSPQQIGTGSSYPIAAVASIPSLPEATVPPHVVSQTLSLSWVSGSVPRKFKAFCATAATHCNQAMTLVC